MSLANDPYGCGYTCSLLGSNRIEVQTMSRRAHRSGAVLALLSASVAFVASAEDAKPAASTPAATEAAKPAPTAAERSPPGGWRVVMRGQTVYWCTKQQQFGSRTRSEERCLTPVQYDELERASQAMVDDMRRAAPPPRGN